LLGYVLPHSGSPNPNESEGALRDFDQRLMKRNHRKVVRKVCPTVTMRLPRPRQAPDVPLIIVETDVSVDERGIQRDERADTWHGHDIYRALHWNYAPGKNPITSCAVPSIVN